MEDYRVFRSNSNAAGAPGQKNDFMHLTVCLQLLTSSHGHTNLVARVNLPSLPLLFAHSFLLCHISAFFL